MNKNRQGGASLIVVLVMLAVLVLAALSMSKVTQTTTLVSGNIATKSASLQASEIGLSEAFRDLKAVAAPDTSNGTWYFATRQANLDTLPDALDWSMAKEVTTGPPTGYKVRYFVDRLCTVTPVTDEDNQCFAKRIGVVGSAKAGVEALDTPASVQFRLTVAVDGPKGTRSFVQQYATR
jgi:type IV pilus assembly protein PilX